jgi:DNA-binding IclR family transcriptional regulator
MAGQRSKPTERVVRVLELLGSQPGRGLRFSELAREGGLSQATCHAILGTLTEAGYVVRDADALTYTLGPAVLALGAAASDSFADVRAAHPALAALSARVGLAVSAAKVVDDEITVIDIALPPGVDSPIRVGARVPFAPPFGAIHVAWSGDAAIEAWIARSPRRTLTRERLMEVVHDHQLTQLAVAPTTETSRELRAALGALADDALARDVRERTRELLAAIDELDYTTDAIASTEHLPVNTLTSPVFDSHGETAFAVALHVGSPDVAVARVEELGAELVDVANRLTERLGGRRPSTPEPVTVLAGGNA